MPEAAATQPTTTPEPARTAGSADREALAGLVERVTFHNPENGFCVLPVKARGQRDLVTVVGHAAMISAGEFVQASGGRVNDRTHGVQFKAAFLRAAPPTTLEGTERYLGSGMIRGIGPVYGKRLVAAFGEAVFDVIEQEPGRLGDVTGIGPRRRSPRMPGRPVDPRWGFEQPDRRVRRDRLRRIGRLTRGGGVRGMIARRGVGGRP